MSKNTNIERVEGRNMGEAVAELKKQGRQALSFIELILQCMSMLFQGKYYDSGTLLAFHGNWLIVDHRPNNPLLKLETYSDGWLDRLINGAMLLTQEYFDAAMEAVGAGNPLVFAVPRSRGFPANIITLDVFLESKL